jgi:hypothetical protein
MSVQNAILDLLTKRKADKMSALTYSVQDLLIGKSFTSFSRKKTGLIQEAIHNPNLFYDGAEAYTVRVRPTYQGMGNPIPQDFWATLCVANQ